MWGFIPEGWRPAPSSPPDPILAKMRKACLSVRKDYDLWEWVALSDEAVLLACAEKATEAVKELLKDG